MKQTIDRIAPSLPWLGLILILIGLIVRVFFTAAQDIVFNLTVGSGAILLLLFAVLRPDDVREFVSGRQVRYGSSSLLSILFFAAIAVMLYYVTFENSDWRYDATETNEFTPLSETITLLENLEEPIHVIGFYNFLSAGQQAQAQAELETMQAYTNQITYEFVDPEENPLLAQTYEVDFNGTLVFTRGEGENRVFSKTRGQADRDYHIALLQVINPVNKKLYFLTGHGERDFEDGGLDGILTAAGLSRDAGFETEGLNLFVTGAVPNDATVIALIDQQAPLDQTEVDAIRDYLRNGGAMLIARDTLDNEGRIQANSDSLAQVLAEDWGIILRDDVIIEQSLAQAGQSFGLTFVGAEYGTSTITGNDISRFGTIFDLSRSIGLAPDVQGILHTELILTSNQAWGETDFDALTQGIAEPNPGEDADGPLTVALSAENPATEARLVVFGDTDFVNNSLIRQGGNGLLFSNALNWLADDEVTADLTPRETVDRQVIISQNQLGLLQIISLCFGPSLMAVIGLWVWLARRQSQ